MSGIIVLMILLGSAKSFADIGLNLELGIPRLASYGIDYHNMGSKFGIGASYSSMSGTVVSAAADAASFGMTSYEVLLRWHMFSGGWFLGTAIGSRTAFAESSLTLNGESAKARAELSGTYLTPQLGYYLYTSVGFTLGVSVGMMSPMSNTTSVKDTVSDPAVLLDANYIALRTDAETNLNKAGKTALPHFGFKLGWYF